MIGAICAMVTFQMSAIRRRSRHRRDAEPASTPRQRKVIETAKVWTRPISSEATNAPAQRAQPADHDDHEQDRAEQSRHVRLRHQRRPGNHAGDRGERGADAEHQHEDAPDIVAEMADHMRMSQRGLDDQPDPRASSARSEEPAKITIDTSSMNIL
jgi:hypothetical protein